jgi:aspartyl-tRNA(Asn)/glutamyl-tRNA(Gln) amidotransferase subunit C
MEIKDVESLAELAKIELSEEEKTKILSDMEGILSYVKQIEEVEVPDFIPEYNHKNQWREDAVREEDIDKDSIVNQFPNSSDNFVKVKKIL